MQQQINLIAKAYKSLQICHNITGIDAIKEIGTMNSTVNIPTSGEITNNLALVPSSYRSTLAASANGKYNL